MIFSLLCLAACSGRDATKSGCFDGRSLYQVPVVTGAAAPASFDAGGGRAP
jgi:hypothetical protein